MSNKKVRDPVTKGRARVPVIMQMEALECGAASLAMVMAYYGKWIPLEQVRLDCGVSRDGSNAKNMLVAARSYGFEAQGFRCETEALREGVPFPCIIHWNFNHFVVLNGFRGKYAWINDPARGEVKVPIEDFDQAFTGICLQITPGENFEPSGKKKSTLAFARSRLKGAGAAVAFVLLSTVIGYLFGIINPVFSRFFMDRLLTGENRELLYPFLVLMIVMGAAQVIVSWIQAVYSLKINGKMAIVGSSEFMWKILRMPTEFFSQRLAGDILQRQGTNASIAATLVNTLTPLLLNTIMMIVYLVVMLRCSVLLTAVGLVTIVLNLLVSQLITAKRVNITRVQLRDSGKLAAATVSGIQMVETIKASGAENGYFQKWAGYQASVNAQNVRFARLNQILGMIPAALSAIVCHLAAFFSARFSSSFTTDLAVWTGMIRQAPSSTAFWTMSSILSDLGSPWKRYTRTGSSASALFTKRRRSRTASSEKDSIPYRYSSGSSSKRTLTSSPGFIRSTFRMWLYSLPCTVSRSPCRAEGSMKICSILRVSFLSRSATRPAP